MLDAFRGDDAATLSADPVRSKIILEVSSKQAENSSSFCSFNTYPVPVLLLPNTEPIAGRILTYL
jgi:hypothetical protein